MQLTDDFGIFTLDEVLSHAINPSGLTELNRKKQRRLPDEERNDSELGRVQLKIVSNRYLEKSK